MAGVWGCCILFSCQFELLNFVVAVCVAMSEVDFGELGSVHLALCLFEGISCHCFDNFSMQTLATWTGRIRFLLEPLLSYLAACTAYEYLVWPFSLDWCSSSLDISQSAIRWCFSSADPFLGYEWLLTGSHHLPCFHSSRISSCLYPIPQGIVAWPSARSIWKSSSLSWSSRNNLGHTHLGSQRSQLHSAHSHEPNWEPIHPSQLHL